MVHHGYNYSAPVAAVSDPKWAAEGSSIGPTQIAVASADIACKLTTNLVGVAVAVQSAYDDRYLNTHIQALVQFREQISTLIRDGST